MDSSRCLVSKAFKVFRAVANSEWSRIFDVVSVEVLPWTKSDHNSLLVFFSKNNEMTWRKRRQFRYEASWEKHQEYSQLVKQVWRVWNNFELAWRKVRNNLKCCQRAFQKWVRKEGGKVEDQIVKKERELQLFQMQEDDFDIDKENQNKDDLQNLLEQWSSNFKVLSHSAHRFSSFWEKTTRALVLLPGLDSPWSSVHPDRLLELWWVLDLQPDLVLELWCVLCLQSDLL
jgi:hypothetical protein